MTRLDQKAACLRRGEEARRLKQSGLSYREIGAQFRCSYQRVQQLVAGPKLSGSVKGNCVKCEQPHNRLCRHHVSYDPPIIELVCQSCHMKHHGFQAHNSGKQLKRQLSDDAVFAKNLRAWRSEKNFTQKQAAEFLRVNLRTYQSWEEELFEPSELAMAEIERRMNNPSPP